MRICSLLPGATEVVAALGLVDDLVAISHEPLEQVAANETGCAGEEDAHGRN